MIYDTLNNLPNYLGVSDNLDTVIEYIMARDITTLPAGRTRIAVPAPLHPHHAGDRSGRQRAV